MIKQFIASPSYMKRFIFLLYAASQTVWLILFWGGNWLFLLTPVFVIPLAVVVSAFLWRGLNRLAK